MTLRIIVITLLIICIGALIITQKKYLTERFVNNIPKVAVIALVRRPVDFSLWLSKLREIGISHFFLRIEDTPSLEEFLKTQKDISFKMGASSTGNNYESLQQRQVEFVNKSIKAAEELNIKWVFHIDSDELLEGSLTFLDSLEPKFKCVKMENVEAVYSETEESCFSSKKFVKCKEIGAKCRSYVNGKSGARVESGVALAGPHDFSYNGAVNNQTITYIVPFEKLHVLHYDSCTFGSWAEKFSHLSKENATSTPFKYYNESIEQTQTAFATYKKHTMNADKSHIYTTA